MDGIHTSTGITSLIFGLMCMVASIIRSRRDSIFLLNSHLVTLITYRFENIIVPPVERKVSDFDPTPIKRGNLIFVWKNRIPLTEFRMKKTNLYQSLILHKMTACSSLSHLNRAND